MANNTSSPKPGPASETLISALHHLLRPLARLLLANGIGYSTVMEIMKSVFVRVAEEDFRIAGKAQTDSRISLLSGVHRKDVKRLRNAPDDRLRQSSRVSLSTQLLALWTASPEYLDTHGNPKPLPRQAGKDGKPSFESLVTSVSKDIRPRAVLDEWVRIGAVELDLEDRVRLNADAFIPRKGLEEKAFYFGHNIHDHIAAAEHNLSGTTPPFLDRFTYYGQLSDKAVAELEGLARKTGMQALQSVNRRAMDLKASEKGSPDRKQRMTFGIYFYSTEDQEIHKDAEA